MSISGRGKVKMYYGIPDMWYLHRFLRRHASSATLGLHIFLLLYLFPLSGPSSSEHQSQAADPRRALR